MLLVGCKTPVCIKPTPKIEIVVPKMAPIKIANDDLLSYYRNSHQLSETELLRTFFALNAMPQNSYSDMQRAIILGCLRGPTDLLKAMALLDGILKSDDPQTQHLQPMATLLYANYSEWHRLDEALDKQAQQLRDTQKRVDQLNQKLDDLKAIEQQLPNRRHLTNEDH